MGHHYHDGNRRPLQRKSASLVVAALCSRQFCKKPLLLYGRSSVGPTPTPHQTTTLLRANFYAIKLFHALTRHYACVRRKSSWEAESDLLSVFKESENVKMTQLSFRHRLMAHLTCLSLISTSCSLMHRIKIEIEMEFS